MISAVFIDRPRLSMVIAFIITIAGALALMQIPVAQFPDIVPPQVTVSGTFPGASAEVVESSVAQPLEAQIIGVDRALYMKSTSANDGSYTLTVSFALGTNPDINTVNVNNRVQSALSQLPTEVQQQGVTVHKRSSSILQFLVLYSANGQQDPLFITNYAIINVLDAIASTPGVGQANLFAKMNYSMRIWFDTQRLYSPASTSRHRMSLPRFARKASRRLWGASVHVRSATTNSSSSMCRPWAGSPPSTNSPISCCAPTRTARRCS
ncbi:multidrug efflux pump subunit AcrB [Bradyrhizobium diazoefficiens]